MILNDFKAKHLAKPHQTWQAGKSPCFSKDTNHFSIAMGYVKLPEVIGGPQVLMMIDQMHEGPLRHSYVLKLKKYLRRIQSWIPSGN